MNEHTPRREIEELVGEFFYSPTMREADALVAEIKATSQAAEEAIMAGELKRGLELMAQLLSKNGELTLLLNELEQPGGMTVEQAAILKTELLEQLKSTGLPEEDLAQLLEDFLNQRPGAEPPPGWE